MATEKQIQVMAPRFNYRRMREVFYEWHGGQFSPLYAAASSGLVDDVDALRRELIVDALHCEDPKIAPFTGPRAAQKNRREAAYLRRIANALPIILSAPRIHSCGVTYRGFPWAKWN